MLKMAVYSEANAILGSSLSPSNYCICKATAIANGADASKIELIVANAASNRLIPVSALLTSVVTYTIRFLDWDNTVLKTEYVVAGSNPTPPSNPTRSGYTFSGWSPSIGVASLNLDYTATYTQDVQQNTYTIVFAENRTYSPGIYFVMDDYTVVPVSSSGSINSSDVLGVAYLDANPIDSFLIDTVDAENILFGYPQVNDQYDAETIYNSLGYHGYDTTQLLMQEQNSMSPMPSITHCINRGATLGDMYNSWYIPTTSELLSIIGKLGDVNNAMDFIGGSPILFDLLTIPEGLSYEIHSGSHPYWTCTYEDTGLSSVSVYCPVQLTRTTITGLDPLTHQPITNLVTTYSYAGYYQSTNVAANLRLIKHVYVACPVTPLGEIYQTMTVEAGVTPDPNTPSKEGYVFGGWTPTLYPADKNEVYAADWYEELTPGNPYTIFCEGVAPGGIVYVDVHTTSLSISWTGPTPIDNQWDVSGSGPGQAQAGYHSWGSGYLNNLNFTSTTTILNGASVGYTVYAVHPSAGESTSIGGSWEVRVVESH